MENLLLDQAFWLHHLDEEDAWINVLIDEESLSSMYRGIMMQEGKKKKYFKIPTKLFLVYVFYTNVTST